MALRHIQQLVKQNQHDVPTELYTTYKHNRQILRDMPQLHYPPHTQIHLPRDHTYRKYATQYYPQTKTGIPERWWQDQHLTPLFSTGDGSCFYNSASLLLTGTEQWSMRIRLVCAATLLLNYQLLHMDTRTMAEELKHIANPYGAVYPSTAGLLLATVLARPVMILTPQLPETPTQSIPDSVAEVLLQDSTVHRPLTMYSSEVHPLIIGRANYVTSIDKVGDEHTAGPVLLQQLNHYIPVATSDAHTAFTLMQLPWLKQQGLTERHKHMAAAIDDNQPGPQPPNSTQNDYKYADTTHRTDQHQQGMQHPHSRPTHRNPTT